LAHRVDDLGAGQIDRMSGLVVEGEGGVQPRGVGRVGPASALLDPVVPEPVDIGVMQPEDRVLRRRVVFRTFGDAATAGGLLSRNTSTHSADHMLPLVSEPPVN
jgi:hypothetical protein